MIEPQPPAEGFSALVALVSPVSSKKKLRKPLPGWNWPFSGRLNGVAPAAFAARFALKGAGAIHGRVVHRDPPRPECVAVRMQRQLVGAVQHLQRLKLAVLQVAGRRRHVSVDEAVR